MRHWDNYYRYFPPSIPREAKGGIRAQSKRGSFGQSWWARRWIAVLEGFHIGARLNRGRSYARRGQVLSISIEKGLVRAEVQGSRPKPYEVAIQVKRLTTQSWNMVAKALSQQAIFAAKLLSGEMPQDIEKVFEQVGLTLFPEKLHDLVTDCSCPDWSNPCKHTAAVFYLLGEEFDRDPFLIFKMRGRSREELIAPLGSTKGETGRIKARKATSTSPVHQAATPSEPLSPDANRFWAARRVSDDFYSEVRTPPLAAALPKRLGSFPFWRGKVRFLEAIEPVYAKTSEDGMRLLLGEAETEVVDGDEGADTTEQ
ncbi:MAG TPA: SWIM zinc finger family protein [Terriglobia bacterium]|jgi:uncharacterized Zn finger protein|nr:SWIM zinc finger family protein [Terriglobia bacterium]